MSHAPLIGVCGPIGAGKSTVAHALARTLGFTCWPERPADNPFFDLYMQDRMKWAYLSQREFMLAAVQDAGAARRSPSGGVLERPVEEMFGVFARHLRATGALTDLEYAALERIAKLGEAATGHPDVLIVLRADPGFLLTRIRARNRPGERTYDLAELQLIEASYERWRGTLANRAVIDVDVTSRDLGCEAEIEKLACEVRAATRPVTSQPA